MSLEKKKEVQVYLTQDMHKKLKGLSVQMGVPMTSVVRFALNYYFKVKGVNHA